MELDQRIRRAARRAGRGPQPGALMPTDRAGREVRRVSPVAGELGPDAPAVAVAIAAALDRLNDLGCWLLKL